MTLPPLSGHDARILELLEAGRSFDDVCEIGRHRKSWRPSAVHRVVSQYLPERRPKRITPPAPPLPAVKERHRKPPPPIVHGTEAGYRNHHRHGQTPCDACCDARNEADRDRKRKRTA